ncbi:MAG: hypothetical protein JW724_04460 [Candidatus Altiarchaeota archaeon]|nr:hypothetical protein [Candidatus Altiarchaeota archaeon]
MTGDPQETALNETTQNRCLKIIATDRHDTEHVRRILERMDPEYFILESRNRMNNLKTLYIAQNLRREGCRDVQMKFYKGELLKVLFSRAQRRPETSRAQTDQTSGCTPRTLPQGKGAAMSDIDHKTLV